MVPGNDLRQARTEIQGLTRPDPVDQAMRIVAWAICWPWSVVWTLCVYNPFRYIAEFVLREIQSALFDISNGQFRAIEKDLTLEPLPPPFPVQSQLGVQSHVGPSQLGAIASVVPSAVGGVTCPATQRSASVPASSAVEAVPVLQTQVPATAADSVPVVAASSDAAVEQRDADVECDEVEPRDAAAKCDEVEPAVSVEDEQQLEELESTRSHTWAPPEQTAYVPMSETPLRALKYDNGVPSDRPIVPESGAAASEADPWFRKHTPDR